MCIRDSRDTARELIAMQMEESVTDEEIQKQQEKLNQVYDTYTAKYGVCLLYTSLEKEKAAEKAEVKGGIHGRLEKAKAEIKEKESDKVPKNCLLYTSRCV